MTGPATGGRVSHPPLRNHERGRRLAARAKRAAPLPLRGRSKPKGARPPARPPRATSQCHGSPAAPPNRSGSDWCRPAARRTWARRRRRARRRRGSTCPARLGQTATSPACSGIAGEARCSCRRSSPLLLLLSGSPRLLTAHFGSSRLLSASSRLLGPLCITGNKSFTPMTLRRSRAGTSARWRSCGATQRRGA